MLQRTLDALKVLRSYDQVARETKELRLEGRRVTSQMQSRQRGERLWSAQHRVAQVLATAETLAGGAEAIMEAVAESADERLGLFLEVVPDGGLRLRRIWRDRATSESRASTAGSESAVPDGAEDTAAAGSRFNGLPVSGGVAAEVLATGSAAWQTPIGEEDESLLARLGAEELAGSSFAFPIVADNVVVAVMSFYSEKYLSPDEPLLNACKAIGELMGQFARRRQAEIALREREEHYRLALASSETGTWELDLKTGHEVWSEQLFRLYGLDPVTTRPSYELWLSLLHPEDRERLNAKTQKLPKQGHSNFYDEFRMIHSRKGLRWMLSRGQVFYDEDGEGRAMRGTIVDITDRKRAEEEIQKLNRELEQRVWLRTRDLAASNAELESFAYSVSHDLRAPLRGIDGFSQALLEDYGDVLDEQARGYLTRVRTGARRMGQLIDDLLNLSRLSQQEVRREKVDLSRLAREIGRQLTPEREAERVPELKVQPGVTCLGDAGLLRLVLENLIGNACKFTRDRANPLIEFGMENTDEGTAFFVRDNGIGFDPRFRNKLFGAFQRLHNSEEYEGSGIGLATVKRIIQRHHGRVWAEGVVDAGATFYFTVYDDGRRTQDDTHPAPD